MLKYKVAVYCTSYNHAPYIKNTLDGLSSQVTDFKYVTVVIDDASTDGTQEIIKQYIDTNFRATDKEDSQDYRNTEDAIIYFRQHKENNNCYLAAILLKYNFYQLKKSKDAIMSEWTDQTEYWAMCECDDYWTYNKKLQEEVDFLDHNNDYALVYTDYDINNYDTGEYVKAAFRNGKKPIITSFEQHLVKAGYIAPMSWLCRIPLRNLMNAYQGPPSIDTTFIIALEIFLQAKVHFLDKVTCVYGKHAGSATKQTSIDKQYEYSYGVYATQKYYLDRYHLREKYPTCLDYFLNAYYNYILANKITSEYSEVSAFFHRKSKSSPKFHLFEFMMKSKILTKSLQAICKLRLLSTK